MHIRQPIQRFNPLQSGVAILAVIFLILGIYLFLAKVDSKTFFGEFLHKTVLTKKQLKQEEDMIFQKQADAEFNDDDDF